MEVAVCLQATACSRSAAVQRTSESAACQQAADSMPMAQVLGELRTDMKLAFRCGLTHACLPGLVAHNPLIAVEVHAYFLIHCLLILICMCALMHFVRHAVPGRAHPCALCQLLGTACDASLHMVWSARQLLCCCTCMPERHAYLRQGNAECSKQL